MIACATVISLMLPFSYQVGPLRLPPYLLLLVLLFFPLVFTWLSQRKSRIVLSDILMLSFCCWTTAALLRTADLASVAQPIGVQFLTTFGAYLTGRMFVRDATSMRIMIRAAVVCLGLILPAVAIEVVTGTKVLLRAATLFGTPLPAAHIGARLGLTRAQGPFEHPILMGVFAASTLSLGFYAFRDRAHSLLRWSAPLISMLVGVMSLSTGALLSLNIQLGLMMWSRILRPVHRRWRLLAVILIAAYVAIDLVSTRTPFHVFVRYATFSSGSSYNRILIWQFGSAEALRHPLFGIGTGEWTRPRYMSDSMDNFWLVQAVRYGIPAFLMLAASIIIILWRAGKAPLVDPAMLQLRRGALFSIIATMTAITSVHLWNATYVWFMFLIGSSAWMSIPPARVHDI